MPISSKGQATVGLEMLDNWARRPTCGHAGRRRRLAAGITRLLADLSPMTRAAFAEPEGGASLREALRTMARP